MGAVVQELERGLLTGHAGRPARGAKPPVLCIHAVALANLVEMTGNLALGYSLPDDARFIVAGMGLDYVKKARGTITGECRIPSLSIPARSRNIRSRVTLRDEGGDAVVEGTLRTLVGPKQ